MHASMIMFIPFVASSHQKRIMIIVPPHSRIQIAKVTSALTFSFLRFLSCTSLAKQLTARFSELGVTLLKNMSNQN